MKFNSRLERCAGVLLVVASGVLVSGTKACQEDYNFASQSNVPSSTGTPVSSATPTPTETGSATATGSPIAVGSATQTPSATETDIPESAGASNGNDLFNELSALSEGGVAGNGVRKAAVQGDPKAGTRGGNWLGEAFSKDGEASWGDQDGDGYSDALEEESDSNAQDANSVPKIAGTRLEDRIRPQEVELDADQRGDDSHAGGDAEPSAADTDMDGIPDEAEVQRGTNPSAIDSDSDGIRDDREIVLGTNPLRTDSDGDGVSDSREYSNGTDPTIPEPKK